MAAFSYLAGQNDSAARDRAFYLLKKYTSATLLQKAIALYRGFLNDLTEEINKPGNYRNPYANALDSLEEYRMPLENAEPLLTSPEHRSEAFDVIRQTARFANVLWGYQYQEALGASNPESLFHKLGYRPLPQHCSGLFGKAAQAAALMLALCRTTADQGIKKAHIAVGDDLETREVMCWTYRSIFFDTLPHNNIPEIVFPDDDMLPPCPPRNESTEGQLWSGQKIPTTGIWEPWSLDPSIGVRCPNYFLEKDTASQYQFAGSGTGRDVIWRLIWKDTRYEDGHIPYEEKEYFAYRVSASQIGSILAHPGESCPESGRWYSPQLKRYEQISAGDPMPGPETNHMGGVIWYLSAEERKKNAHRR